jgi:acetate kinase
MAPEASTAQKNRKKDSHLHGSILVFNAGSSSLKFSLFERDSEEALHLGVRGQIEAIGTLPRLEVKDATGKRFLEKELDPGEIRDASGSLGILLPWIREHLRDGKIEAIGHRVVHGGPKYSKPVRINAEVLEELRSLVALAPLHQPYSLAPIENAFAHMPHTPQVACFDTAFHRSHPPVAEILPLPAEFFEAGVRRYGFHGLSYEYVASTLSEWAPEIAEGRVIIAHLGNGASLCAIKNRRNLDSTMSFTALDGLCMGTRPGALDPGAVLYLFQNRHLSVKEVENLLYHESGLLGISGISSDMRDLLGSEEPRARLAIDYFVYRVSKEIGALTAVLGGLDGLVFTAGIGENSAMIRKRICQAAAWLDLKLDDAANENSAQRISASDSRVSAWVISTNEELMIAKHTTQLLGAGG